MLYLLKTDIYELFAGNDFLPQVVFDMRGMPRSAPSAIKKENGPVVTCQMNRRLQAARTGADNDAIVRFGFIDHDCRPRKMRLRQQHVL